MIKRNGVEIKSAVKKDKIAVSSSRNENVVIAEETLKICLEGGYTSPEHKEVVIADDLDYAVKNSVYYPNAIAKNKAEELVPFIEFVNESTSQAGERLIRSGKESVAALNFAAGRNPGGDFLGGSRAQEEALCRASGLYPCLLKKPLFYNANLLNSPFYTDGVIYSPSIPFFRDKDNKLIEEPFNLSILTCPAPCLIGIDEDNLDRDELDKLLFRRVKKILRVAAKHQHTNLVLGAWGCGAFCNSPYDVAYAFKRAVAAEPYFQHITFAILDSSEGETTLKAFNEVFTET